MTREEFFKDLVAEMKRTGEKPNPRFVDKETFDQVIKDMTIPYVWEDGDKTYYSWDEVYPRKTMLMGVVITEQIDANSIT